MTWALLLAASLSAAPVQQIRLEDCVKKSVCWNLVRAAFGEVFSAMKTEAEGSGPGRFFPGMVVFTDDPGPGHFLQVRKATRRGMGVEVEEERDELERRLIQAALLSALPKEDGAGELFAKTDWALTSEGRKVLARLEKARPGALKQADGWAHGRGGPAGPALEPLKIDGRAPKR